MTTTSIDKLAALDPIFRENSSSVLSRQETCTAKQFANKINSGGLTIKEAYYSFWSELITVKATLNVWGFPNANKEISFGVQIRNEFPKQVITNIASLITHESCLNLAELLAQPYLSTCKKPLTIREVWTEGHILNKALKEAQSISFPDFHWGFVNPDQKFSVEFKNLDVERRITHGLMLSAEVIGSHHSLRISESGIIKDIFDSLIHLCEYYDFSPWVHHSTKKEHEEALLPTFLAEDARAMVDKCNSLYVATKLLQNGTKHYSPYFDNIDDYVPAIGSNLISKGERILEWIGNNGNPETIEQLLCRMPSAEKPIYYEAFFKAIFKLVERTSFNPSHILTVNEYIKDHIYIIMIGSSGFVVHKLARFRFFDK